MLQCPHYENKDNNFYFIKLLGGLMNNKCKCLEKCMVHSQYPVHFFCYNYNFYYFHVNYGRQTLTWSPMIPNSCIHTLVQSPPFEGRWDLLVASNQGSAAKVMDATAMTRLQKTGTSVTSKLSLVLHWLVCVNLKKASYHIREAHVTRNWRQSATRKELNSANNVSLEVNPSPVKPSDETPALDYNLY